MAYGTSPVLHARGEAIDGRRPHTQTPTSHHSHSHSIVIVDIATRQTGSDLDITLSSLGSTCRRRRRFHYLVLVPPLQRSSIGLSTFPQLDSPSTPRSRTYTHRRDISTCSVNSPRVSLGARLPSLCKSEDWLSLPPPIVPRRLP